MAGGGGIDHLVMCGNNIDLGKMRMSECKLSIHRRIHSLLFCKADVNRVVI